MTYRRPFAAVGLAALSAAAFVLPTTTAHAAPAGATLAFGAVRSSGPMGAADEYAQVRNVSNAPVDLTGYRLKNATTTYPLPTITLEAGTAHTMANVQSQVPCAAQYINAADFVPATGTLKLLDRAGNVVATRHLPANDVITDC